MNLPYPDVVPDTTYDQRPQPHHGGICPACRMNASTLWQLPDASVLRHHRVGSLAAAACHGLRLPL
ncbi:hypothetical protein [Escherichia coli]|uniref:hypothetical protein n=1 Tax=Escherichia coli TaxID=562 RepID=UPI000B7EAAEB|nr:hypothetical protein [Escherichia coli]